MPLPIFRVPVGKRACVEGHSVIITDRGGVTQIVELKDISEVKWGRTRDGRSSASVTITGAACRRQTKKLAQIEPKRHEMVVYRGRERVWEGPVRYVKSGRNAVSIYAYDVLDYVQGRPMTKHWPGPPVGPTLMTERVLQILTYELTTAYTAPGTTDVVPAWESLDPPINVLEHLEVRPGAIQTTAEVLPFEMTTLEHLTNLARGGLDFTAVGRRIIVWDSAQPLGRLRTMTESDIEGDPVIYSDGDDLVTVQHVIGQPEEDEPDTSTTHVGSYVRDMAYYGPWAKIHTRSDEAGSGNTQAALNTQARALSAGKVPVPVELQIGTTASVRVDPKVGINGLVPGVEIPIIARLGGREVRQVQRLERLEVSETKDGESIQATIGTGKAGD